MSAIREFTIFFAVMSFFFTCAIYSSVDALKWSTFRSWRCARICNDNGVAWNVNYICGQVYVDATGNGATGACEDVSILVQKDNGFDLPPQTVNIGVCRDTSKDNLIVKCVSAASADHAIRIYNVDYNADGSFKHCGGSLEQARPVPPPPPAY